jgi:lysozyme
VGGEDFVETLEEQIMSKLPARSLPWPISWEGVVEVARSESCRLTAYKDIVGVWTIGWGETRGVVEGMILSQAEADGRLCQSLTEFRDQVLEACVVRPSDNELSAMVSLAYNIGMGWKGRTKPKGAKSGFRQSTVLRCHNKGDTQGASRAFGLWNKAGGKVVNGLTLRRAREAAIYLTPTYDIEQGVPQAVDAESNLQASPIAQSGVASVAGGALAVASTMSSTIKETAANLGVEPLLVVAAIALVVGAVTIYQRMKQRKEGWA